MHPNFDLFQKLLRCYDETCKVFCREQGIPQTSFDILMFLANNPAYKTARDIVEVRGLKANLVSIHIDRLEQEGYLTRSTVAGDRRKRELHLTPEAAPIVRAGREMQQRFFAALEQDISQEQKQTIHQVLEIMHRNINQLLEE